MYEAIWFSTWPLLNVTLPPSVKYGMFTYICLWDTYKLNFDVSTYIFRVKEHNKNGYTFIDSSTVGIGIMIKLVGVLQADMSKRQFRLAAIEKRRRCIAQPNYFIGNMQIINEGGPLN